MNLSIKQKIYLIVIIIVIIVSTGLTLTLTILRNTRFEKIEKEQAVSTMNQVSNMLDFICEEQNQNVEYYAQNRELSNLILNGDKKLIHLNIVTDVLYFLDVSFLCVYDANGNILCGGEIENEEFIASDESPELFDVKTIDRNSSGFFSTEEGIQYASIVEVIDKTENLGTIGYLVMGWDINEHFIEEISKQLNMPITMNENIDDTFSDEQIEKDIYVKTENDDSVIVSKIYYSYYGEEIFQLEMQAGRILASQVNTIRTRLILATIILIVVLVLVVRVLHSKWIGVPLNDLVKIINNVNDFSSDKLEELIPRNDEIGELARVFKHLKVSMDLMYDDINKQVVIRTEELMQANEQLRIFKKIFENTSEGIIITNLDGEILDINHAMCDMTGFSREELMHQNPRLLKSGRHSTEFYKEMWSKLISIGEWQGEIWDRKADGEVYPKWLNINSIENMKGEKVYYVALSTDITVIKSTEDKLNNLAYYDTLTGLANRTLFLDRLTIAIEKAKREKGHFAILYLDLDRFKYINDTYGHSMGDILLQQAAVRIQSCVRKNDTVARIGGDEYAIILEGISDNYHIRRIANNIITGLSTKFEIKEEVLYVGASVGISLYPKDSLSREELVKEADTAMYVAKNNGGNRFYFAAADVDKISKKRMQIEVKLHNAIQNNEMHLYYQAQTLTEKTTEGKAIGIIGAEALIRWEKEPGEILSPIMFIDILEETGLIVEVGQWVIFEACKQARIWLDKGRAIQVSVNVSVIQFMKGDMYSMVKAALEKNLLPPELLKIEVTESILMQNMDRVVKEMNAIKRLGVSFAIDDFGTGYSSLKYVNVLPINAIKIDKAFIKNITSSTSTSRIVDAMIMIAKALNFTSIAEGVEDKEVLGILAAKGCDQIQGYYVAKPMPADDFIKFVFDE